MLALLILESRLIQCSFSTPRLVKYCHSHSTFARRVVQHSTLTKCRPPSAKQSHASWFLDNKERSKNNAWRREGYVELAPHDHCPERYTDQSRTPSSTSKPIEGAGRRNAQSPSQATTQTTSLSKTASGSTVSESMPRRWTLLSLDSSASTRSLVSCLCE